MAYPLIECRLLDKVYADGKILAADDESIRSFYEPCGDMTYYETVRIYEGKLLFIEDHLGRLMKSVEGGEAFPVDTDKIKSEVKRYMDAMSLGAYNGNLRIVLTKDHLIFHICEANIPAKELFEKGICTNILKWERIDPNIKVFRGDYKKAVADRFAEETPFGMPYEVLLENREGKLTEGSKSNFFVIKDGAVYSPADDVILIGITRKYVLQALNDAGIALRIGTFSLDELGDNDALFVSSTPFDILPISSVNDRKFDSVNNEILKKISAMYKGIVQRYCSEH